jgi:sugar phosphate permease
VTQAAAAVRRYRWTVLAVGTTAQATFSVFTIGLPVMLPEVRSEYGLTLAQTGLLLAAANVGTMLGMLPWGLAADRVGERLVVGVGLAAAGVAMLVAAGATSFGGLSALLALAGLGGASVAAASGRAVMHWFPHHERGLAMGVRQSAIPVAGAVSALVLPVVIDAGGVGWGFAAIGIGILFGAALAAAFLRDAGHEDGETASLAEVMRNRRTWLLSGSAALLLVPQIALFGFTVLFLHDDEGLSTTHAALVFACVQVLAIAARIGVGHWSDVVGSRIRPLRLIAVASAVAALATALLTGAPLALLAPVLVLAAVVAASWNGLAFAAAAEAVDRNRVGAALGVQQTVLFGAGAVVAPVFAALVDGAGWSWGFAAMALGPALAYLVLGRVGERRAR